ncbi:porin [Ectothiorhodospira marina]|uniref:Outer membrane protein (Porin) n=1 Tax=Ectothiorhodospira marina TaxID=1396821 RepID=A0A1H7P537_9GAMM|nr:porin [Ectothiorhodospira marina]SEL30689.1 Outer membrane protein (porin) [Ectothiorhodospira marina]
MHHKKLIAAMVAVGVSMPALAVADMTLYGRAHLSTDLLDDGADYSELNISSNSSRLGFKGQHEVNPNLTAIFQIEQEIFFDTKDNSEDFATRDTFAGLKGDWGMVRIGRFDTPFKKARGPANFFGDQVGDMRNLTKANGNFDDRFRNTLHYQSPALGGMVWDISYSPENTSEETKEESENSAFSTSLGFEEGPMNVIVAYERQNYQDSPNPDGWRLAGAYEVTPAFTLAGFFQSTEGRVQEVKNGPWLDGPEGEVFGVGGQYQLSPSMYLKAHYFTLDSDCDDSDADMYTLGLEYRMDKALRFYGNLAAVSNDDAAALTPWGQARSATPPGEAGETATAFSLGMRYDF